MLPRDIVSHVFGDNVAGFKLMEINKPVAAFQEVRHVKMEVQSNQKSICHTQMLHGTGRSIHFLAENLKAHVGKGW